MKKLISLLFLPLILWAGVGIELYSGVNFSTPDDLNLMSTYLRTYEDFLYSMFEVDQYKGFFEDLQRSRSGEYAKLGNPKPYGGALSFSLTSNLELAFRYEHFSSSVSSTPFFKFSYGLSAYGIQAEQEWRYDPYTLSFSETSGTVLIRYSFIRVPLGGLEFVLMGEGGVGVSQLSCKISYLRKNHYQQENDYWSETDEEVEMEGSDRVFFATGGVRAELLAGGKVGVFVSVSLGGGKSSSLSGPGRLSVNVTSSDGSPYASTESWEGEWFLTEAIFSPYLMDNPLRPENRPDLAMAKAKDFTLSTVGPVLRAGLVLRF